MDGIMSHYTFRYGNENMRDKNYITSVSFRCETMQQAINGLSLMPPSVETITIKQSIKPGEDADLRRFLFKLPRSVRHLELRFLMDHLPDRFFETLMMGIPHVQGILFAIKSKNYRWLEIFLDTLNKAPWFGFNKLAIDGHDLSASDAIVRIIPRLSEFTIRGQCEDIQIITDLEDALCRSRLKYFASMSNPMILPDIFPTSMEHFRIYIPGRMDEERLGRIVNLLKHSLWRCPKLHTIQVNADHWAVRPGALYKIIRPWVGGLRRLDIGGEVKDASPVFDLLMAPECAIDSFSCSMSPEFALYILYMIRSRTRIRRLSMYIPRAITMPPSEEVRRIDTIAYRFKLAINHHMFRVVQALLSMRYVPRFAHSTLLSEVAWEEYIHPVARALGWRIDWMNIGEEGGQHIPS